MKKIDIHTHVPKDDPNMDQFLSVMDANEIDAVLLHGVPLPGKDNEQVLRAIRIHPDRFYGSVHIDLRQPIAECIEIMSRYADYGFKSIKLFPNLGFDPNDEHLEPFWQALEGAGLLCLSHCGYLSGLGTSTDRICSLTASPFHFEVPIRRHPKINFIFAHFGGGATYLETIVMISRFPNAFADTCPGWGRWVFEQNMPGLAGLNFSKVLFGTDFAGGIYRQSESWWTETLTRIGVAHDDLPRYFHQNAAGLLGIV